MQQLQGKNITLAITGSIAVYKVCDLARRLIKAGANVRVVMTKAATEFVTPLTFATLTSHPVAVDQFDPTMPHLTYSRDTDLLLVAPATANIIAKAAHGIADDLVSSLIVGRNCPIAFAPAMNVEMWGNPATRRNVEQLKADGAHFYGPACGKLACHVTGSGRLMEPADIVAHVIRTLTPQCMTGHHVVITAGPTQEAIDPVRVMTNLSSGQQGYALAQAMWAAGARVTLISGPTALTPPTGVDVISVRSARSMLAAAQDAAIDADMFISVAAVCDYRPLNVSEHKLKKSSDGNPALSQIEWVENPDILATIKSENPQLFCVGFAAETENIETYAREKLTRKGVDVIVGNPAQDAIGSTHNTMTVVSRNSTEIWPTQTKAQASVCLTQYLANCLKNRHA